MSWSTSVPPTEAANFEAAVDAAELPTYGAPVTWPPETVEQFAAAKVAVTALFRSGVVGTEGYFTASISGHANAGSHQPGESVSVYLYQAQAPAPPEPALATSGAASM